MEFYNEQRKAKRVNTKLRVNCRKNGVFFSDFARDICLDGIKVETPTLVGKNMSVDLSFYLPDEAEPIIVKGRVIWSGVEEHTNFNVVLGIKFEDMSASDRNKLVNFIENQKSISNA
jgi:Tfp pilus assembly protein PilZ